MKSFNTYINERLGSGWKEVKKGDMTAYVLAFDKPSEEYGIDGGKISKLQIKKGYKDILCNYDRGWDTKEGGMPEMDDKLKEFFDEIVKKYN